MALALVACGGDDDEEAAGPELRVFAAGSVGRPLEQLGKEFAKAENGTAVAIELGTSGKLAEQLKDDPDGADVYIGDGADVQGLVKAKLAVGKARRVGRDLLVIAVANDATQQVTSIADFAKPEPVIGLCAEDQSCGRRARTVLKRAGVNAQVDASHENAKALLQKIASGEVDAGIVNRSALRAYRSKVKTVAIDDKVNTTSVYAAVALKTDNAETANEFVRFLLSDAGKAALERFGLLP